MSAEIASPAMPPINVPIAIPGGPNQQNNKPPSNVQPTLTTT